MTICEAPRITEDLLRSWGFKWEQGERQPNKHWLLWLGSACLQYHDYRTDPDSLGIELSKCSPDDGTWYCWMRNDIAGRYSRIIHIRHVAFASEVEGIIAALTGRRFNSADSLYGSLRTPADAERMRKEDKERLDRRANLSWVDRVDNELGVTDKDKRGVVHP